MQILSVILEDFNTDDLSNTHFVMHQSFETATVPNLGLSGAFTFYVSESE